MADFGFGPRQQAAGKKLYVEGQAIGQPDATGRGIEHVLLGVLTSLFRLTVAGYEGRVAVRDGLAKPLMLGTVQCLTAFEVPYAASQVGDLLQELDRKLFDDQPEKRLMLRLCLQRLFVVLFRIWQQNEASGALPDTPAARYFRRFQQLVRQVGTTHASVQFTADPAITPVHPNRIGQELAGKSASQLVQEHILHEARKYLLPSTYSVSKITCLLLLTTSPSSSRSVQA